MLHLIDSLLVRSEQMALPMDLWMLSNHLWRLSSVSGRRSTRKGLVVYRSNNHGRNSMLVFDLALSEIDRSLWKYLRLTTWQPHRVMVWIKRKNEPMSGFEGEVRACWPVQVRCGWSWRFFTKRLLVSVGGASTGKFSVDLVSIVSGASEKLSHLTILDFTLENSIVYI